MSLALVWGYSCPQRSSNSSMHGCTFADASEPYARLCLLSPTVHTNSSIPTILNSFNSRLARGFPARALTNSRLAALNSRGSRGGQDREGTKTWSREHSVVEVWSLTADNMLGPVDLACRRRVEDRKVCVMKRGRVALSLPVFGSRGWLKSPG